MQQKYLIPMMMMMARSLAPVEVFLELWPEWRTPPGDKHSGFCTVGDQFKMSLVPPRFAVCTQSVTQQLPAEEPPAKQPAAKHPPAKKPCRTRSPTPEQGSPGNPVTEPTDSGSSKSVPKPTRLPDLIHWKYGPYPKPIGDHILYLWHTKERKWWTADQANGHKWCNGLCGPRCRTPQCRCICHLPGYLYYWEVEPGLQKFSDQCGL